MTLWLLGFGAVWFIGFFFLLFAFVLLCFVDAWRLCLIGYLVFWF